MQCNTLQCNTTQCSTMQYNTIQYNKPVSLQKEDKVCSESCRFLKEMKQSASGVCPSYTEPNTTRSLDGCSGGGGGSGGGGRGGGGGGGRSCVSDKNCDKDFKCCVANCGMMSCRRALLPSPDGRSSVLP